MPTVVKSQNNKKTYLNYLTHLSKYGVTFLRGFYKGCPTYRRHRHNINDLVSKATYKDCDYFYTPNIFSRRNGDYKADEEHVSGVRMIWFDLDLKRITRRIVYKSDLCTQLKKVFYDLYLPEILKISGLPEPTVIDDSGFGFHIFYIFDHIIPIRKHRKHNKTSLLSMYSKTISEMLIRLDEACYMKVGRKLVDRNNCKNIAKLMRLPGTPNCKYTFKDGYTVKPMCKTIFNSYKVYSLDELYRTYTQKETKSEYDKYRREYNKKGRQWKRLENKHYIANGKRWTKENAKWKRKRGFSNNVVHHSDWKSRYSLYLGRIGDLQTLIKLRNGNMINHYNHKSCNEFAVFLYAVNYVHLSHDKHSNYNLTNALLTYNRALKEPLSDYDVQKIIKETHNPVFKEYGYPLNSRIEGKAHYIKDSWYIDHLGITKKEMKFLKILIDDNEKNRRRVKTYPHKIYMKRIRRRQASKVNGAKYRRKQRIKKVKELHQLGKSYRQIHNELNLGISTIRRYVNYN